ncbi:MAG: RDD family protein [Nanoarchaeota archaeon]
METSYLNMELPRKRYLIQDTGLFKRGLSLLIDLLVLEFIAVMPFSRIFSTTFAGTFAENMNIFEQGLPPGIGFIFAVIIILALIYFTLFQYYFQQTIGMMLTKTYAEGNMTFWKSLFRSIFIIPVFPVYILWIIEPIHIYLRKQSLIERMTNTRTVEYVQMD